MKITENELNQAYEILTDNNFHNDTSILNCYIAFGIVPPDKKEHQELWKILDELKEIDRKNYIVGFLRFEELERRSKLDKRVRTITEKYSK